MNLNRLKEAAGSHEAVAMDSLKSKPTQFVEGKSRNFIDESSSGCTFLMCYDFNQRTFMAFNATPKKTIMDHAVGCPVRIRVLSSNFPQTLWSNAHCI